MLESRTPAIQEPPQTEHASLSMESTSTPGAVPGWLSRNLRNLILLLLAIVVCWIAIAMRNEQAQSALVAAFISLVSVLFGERSALKTPGKDS